MSDRQSRLASNGAMLLQSLPYRAAVSDSRRTNKKGLQDVVQSIGSTSLPWVCDLGQRVTLCVADRERRWRRFYGN
jgi:hypothetical protein